MILGNLMTYGLRMRVNRAVLQSVLPLPLSTDDILTLAALPGSCVLFAVGALLIEWLGLRLLRGQEKVRPWRCHVLRVWPDALCFDCGSSCVSND